MRTSGIIGIDKAELAARPPGIMPAPPSPLRPATPEEAPRPPKSADGATNETAGARSTFTGGIADPRGGSAGDETSLFSISAAITAGELALNEVEGEASNGSSCWVSDGT